MALYARDTQNSVHAVIPIHMGSTTSPLSPQTTSAINLQFNNRERAEFCDVDRRITLPDVNTPVLSIVLELGAEDSEHPETDLVQIKQMRYRSTRSNAEGRHRNGHHYSVVAYGHGSATFGVIPKEVEGLYGYVPRSTGNAGCES